MLFDFIRNYYSDKWFKFNLYGILYLKRGLKLVMVLYGIFYKTYEDKGRRILGNFPEILKDKLTRTRVVFFLITKRINTVLEF